MGLSVNIDSLSGLLVDFLGLKFLLRSLSRYFSLLFFSWLVRSTSRLLSSRGILLNGNLSLLFVLFLDLNSLKGGNLMNVVANSQNGGELLMLGIGFLYSVLSDLGR